MIGVRTEQAEVVVIPASRVGDLEAVKDVHDQLGAGAEHLLQHRFELCFIRLTEFRNTWWHPHRDRLVGWCRPHPLVRECASDQESEPGFMLGLAMSRIGKRPPPHRTAEKRLGERSGHPIGVPRTCNATVHSQSPRSYVSGSLDP